MNTRLSSLFLVVLGLAFTQLSGQNIHPWYWDGQVYVNMVKAPDIGGKTENIDLKSLPFITPELAEYYGVQRIRKPFYRATDPLVSKTYQIYFTQYAKVYELIRWIGHVPLVNYAEQVPILRKTLLPNDIGTNSTTNANPPSGGQWHLYKIQAPDAWDISTGSTSITIAIVDDAVKINHPDLAPNVWVNPGEIAGNNIDDDGNGYVDDVNGFDVSTNTPSPLPPDVNYSHGTHVAGCASQATNNGVGFAGIGFNCKIIGVKSTDNAQFVTDGYTGVVYAADAGARVINMSWGGSGGGTTGQNIINYARNKGCILVAAAGNDNSTSTFFPAGYTNVISVAATNTTDAKASFSNFGSYIKVSAPGTSIRQTYIGGSGTNMTNTYSAIQGTSMASPIVSGLVGLMFSVNPNLTFQQVQNCLYTTTDPVTSNASQMGAGRINAFRCLQCVQSTVNSAPISNVSAAASTVCPGGSVQFFGASTGGPATTYSWSFPGGNPATSTAQNPVVSYTNAGTFDVTLTTTNSFGNHTANQTGFVTVGNGAQATIFLEDFEASSSTVSQWGLVNPNSGSISWEIITTSGNLSGTRSAGIRFFDYQTTGHRDGLVTPVLNLSNYSNIQLTFTHAYRRYNTSSSDSLIIYVSTNGGTNWQRVWQAGENGQGVFATNSTTTNPFVPSTAADWCFGGNVGASCFTINLPTLGGESNVRIMFEGYNNYGNNLYLDDVEITGTCGAPNPNPVADFSSSTQTICEGASVGFTDLSVNATSWNWAFAGGTPNTSTQQNPVIQYNTAGSFQVALTISGPAGSNTSTQPNYVVVNPNPAVSVNASGNTLTASPAGMSYQWFFEGTPLQGETSASITATVSGNYTVEVTSPEGCTVTSPPFNLVVGIEEAAEALGLILFPNPTTGVVRFSFTKAGNQSFRVKVLDQAGRLVFAAPHEVSAQGGEIHLGGIASGMYYLHLTNAEGQIWYGKISVIH